MKNLISLIFLSLLTAALTGCRDFETSASAPAAKSGVDPTWREERATAIYERAMGDSRGLTSEQIRAAVEKLESAPVFSNKFLGVPTLQNPSDAWIIMELLQAAKPDLVVETGTYRGGSAALWAVVLEHINPDGRVITIDVEDQRDPRAIELPVWKRRIDFLRGSSTAPEIVAEVHRRAQGKRVLVVLDSLHSKEHVAAELAAYASLVPVGSYVIVQDTELGPVAAIDEFLAANDSFVADHSCERYPDTGSARGYLKRVKL
jgi:cephalosporin hydroxylase